LIRAFNADKPFDQFIREQIAGMNGCRGSPDEADVDRLIATGFLRMVPYDSTDPSLRRTRRTE